MFDFVMQEVFVLQRYAFQYLVKPQAHHEAPKPQRPQRFRNEHGEETLAHLAFGACPERRKHKPI
jgi:hypothetical protein